MAKLVKGFLTDYPGVTKQVFGNERRIAWKRQPAMHLLHTTEGGNYPSAATYGDGTRAPHLTVDVKARTARQHYPFTEGAWALRAVGVATNAGGPIQYEIIGTSDARSSIKPKVAEFTDDDLIWLGNLLKEIGRLLDIPMVSTVDWVKYPDSYGTKAKQRLLSSQWAKYRGILGHQHTPGGNSHGDPGDFPVSRMISLVENTPTPSVVVTPDLIGGSEMYVVVNEVGNNSHWYVVIPQGTGKPRATMLFGKEVIGTKREVVAGIEGVPIIKVRDQRVLDHLRGSIDGI